MTHKSGSQPLAQLDAAPRSPASRVVEFFLMTRRLAKAHAQASEQGFAECRLGLAALSDAQQLGNSAAGRDTALLLYRAAARLFLPALNRNPEFGSTALALEHWSRSAQHDARVLTTNDSIENALASEGGEAYLAELSPEQCENMLRGLGAFAQYLAIMLPAEASAVRRILWTRRFRLLPVALLAAGAILSVLRIGTVHRNLALHRPVALSDSDPTFGVDPKQVVDGDELNLGFHTGDTNNPSVTIDLGRLVSVTRLEIFNRVDCCQERALPLSVELSSDGRQFTTVERRSRRFQQWEVALPSHSRARFVRLMRGGWGAFHLAEVEVY